MKSVEELKKEYADKLAALKLEKKEVLKQAAERERKKKSAETKAMRKLEAHLKIMLGGYLVNEIKTKKDKALLAKIADTVKKDEDKKLILSVLG